MEKRGREKGDVREGEKWRNRELKAELERGQGNGKRKKKSRGALEKKKKKRREREKEKERVTRERKKKQRKWPTSREGEERNMGQEKLCAKKRSEVGR